MARGQLSEQIENVEYDYVLVSGEVVVAVSGAVKLHAIVINQGTSGQRVTIFDAISGVFGASAKVVGLPYCGDGVSNPVELKYDVELDSGLVIVASGAVWNITATYK